MASKTNVEKFIIQILRGVKFRPTGSRRESHYSGLHSAGFSLGGIGVSYWLAHDVVDVERNVKLIRDLCKRRDLSLVECQDVVKNFIETELHPIIAGNFLLQTRGTDLFSHLREDELKEIVSNAVVFFRCFYVDRDFIVPLNSIETINYEGVNFSLVSNPQGLQGFEDDYRAFLEMPLLKGATAWLRIKARSVVDATEQSSIVLGALFLCMDHNTHYLHTMGKPIDGMLHFYKGSTYASSPPHIPYLACKIELEDEDKDWLKSIDAVLTDRVRRRKFLRALRWLHASWFAAGAERFSLICMSVDAITPSKIGTGRAKCTWIKDNLGVDVDFDAIEMIFKRMRGDVAHGDAPSLIESQAYLDFIERYGADPSVCATAIACRVIRETNIPNMRLQPHPISRHPEYVDREKAIMARYGLEFEVPAGFDFRTLCAQGANPEHASVMPVDHFLRTACRGLIARLAYYFTRSSRKR